MYERLTAQMRVGHVRTPARALLGAALVLLAASGCSAEDAPPSSTTTTPPLVPSSTSEVPASTLPASWEGRRDPCSLLDAAQVGNAVRFRVAQGMHADLAMGGANTCIWANLLHDKEAGLVTLNVVPPGTDLSADEAILTDSIEVDGLPGGARALIGNVAQALGPGMTGAVVTIENSGFSIVLSTFEVRLPEETEMLVRAAVDAWFEQDPQP